MPTGTPPNTQHPLRFGPLNLEQLKERAKDLKDESDVEAAVIAAAFAGDNESVDFYRTDHPGECAKSPYVAAALADKSGIERWEGTFATETGGPKACTLLVYLCCSRFRVNDERIRNARREMVVRLLDAGADANAGLREPSVLRGYRTALGGALGCIRDVDVAKLLIEAGADVADGPTLWEGCALWEAVQNQDFAGVALLLDAGTPHWQNCHALPLSLLTDSCEITELLLARGADPNWTMTTWCFGGNALHEAIMLGHGEAMVNVLLDAGAKLECPDRDGRTCLAIATRVGHTTAADVLVERGASEAAVTPVDRWIAACLRGDRDVAQPQAATFARSPRSFLRTDHQWVPRAIRRQCADAVPLLLAGGLSPNIPDDDGESALHLAVVHGLPALCGELVGAGADVGARNFDGLTPLALARDLGPSTPREPLLSHLTRPGEAVPVEAVTVFDDGQRAEWFECAADAIAAGDRTSLCATTRFPVPRAAGLTLAVTHNSRSD